MAYEVQPGDTLRDVAQRYGVSPESIAQASNLSNANVLTVGQTLTIPTAPGTLYRVQTGEDLNDVAQRTGVPAESIQTASGLTSASIEPGDVLLIPEATPEADTLK